MTYFFAFDLETTGVSTIHDRPVQIAYAVVEPGKPYTITKKLVCPGVPCDPGATKVHGITDAMAATGMPLEALGAELQQVFSQFEITTAVGANVLKFDIPLLFNSLLSVGIELNQLNKLNIEDPSAWFLADYVFRLPRPKSKEDYVRIFERFKPKGTRSNLTYLCELYGIALGGAHDAGEDLKATIELWNKLRIPDVEFPIRYTMNCDAAKQNLIIDVPGVGEILLPLDAIREKIA